METNASTQNYYYRKICLQHPATQEQTLQDNLVDHVSKFEVVTFINKSSSAVS